MPSLGKNNSHRARSCCCCCCNIPYLRMLGLRGSPISQPAANPSPMMTSALTASAKGQTNGNGNVNGHSNGHASTIESNVVNEYTESYRSETRSENHLSQTESRTLVGSSYSHTFSSDQQVTVLRQTVMRTRDKFLHDSVLMNEQCLDDLTIQSFKEFIECERLNNMPKQGSKWDKVLKWAEFFATQISEYEKAIRSFVPDSQGAAKLIWAACRILIELGQENSQAIETAFAVFYKVALSLSFFLHHREIISLTSHIRREIGQAFDDLLTLVRDVALHYRIQISSLTNTEATQDFNSLFRRNLDNFYERKDQIIDAMWASKMNSDDSISIYKVRTWLSIRDDVTRMVLRDRLASRSRRDDHTCDWLQKTLLDFSRGTDKVLAITGDSGSGKSFLWGWTVERLQRRLGKKIHETLSITIDADLPNQCTLLGVAKNLALQLLCTNIGDIPLLGALDKAYKASLGGIDIASLETELWRAVDVGLKNSDARNLVLVVDGLDDRCGHETALAIGHQIGQLVSKHNHVQAIIFARNANHLPKVKTQTLAITPDHTRKDLRHLAKHALRDCQHYQIQTDLAQQETVDTIVLAAKGNLLWTRLVINILKRETSHDGFLKAVKNTKEKTLDKMLRELISTCTADFSKPEAVSLLSWLLVSERPLTVSEIKGLLQVDFQKKSLTSRNSDEVESIITSCSALLTNQNGIVRMQHSAIRDTLLQMSAEGRKLSSFQAMQAMQAELTTRLLAYARFSRTEPCHPTFERLDLIHINSLFLQEPLLAYTASHWIHHFRKSSFQKQDAALTLTADFKAVFPSSTQLALLEWSCWESQTSTFQAVALHELALQIRQDILTQKHESVLQTMIICGRLHKKLSNIAEAGLYFYRAAQVGQSILKIYSTITLSCTTAFLEVTETVTSTTRTETVTRKEELLRYMISACKAQHGKTSDTVIRYSKILAELYVSIQEEQKAEECWKVLHEIMIARYGKGSPEETNISGHLKIVLKKGQKHEEIIEYERRIFDESITVLDLWSDRHIKTIRELAGACEKRGELLKTEEYYVTLWSGLIEHYHHIRTHSVDTDVHLSMIDISLEYVHFLRRHHRHEEAAGVLICIWAEYEEYTFESEIIFLRLKKIGELMRATSLLSIAVSVFKKCWAWFKSHGKLEISASCQMLISETIEQIITTTQTTTVSTSTTTATSTEIIVREVFESSISKSTITIETISIYQSLISLYMKSENWAEAIHASKRSLELIWKMIVSGRGTIALCREFSSEAIDIAIRLAICHQRSHHFHEAEAIYIRIYRACFNSCQANDERLTKASSILVKFYEEHEHWHKVVAVHQELLVAYRKHLGRKHSLTIKTLYTLGSLCSVHGHGQPHEYYEEIITVINADSKVCHHEALVAMEIMCRFYFEGGHWQKLKQVCEVLWETWVHHHHDHKLEAHFIELLYMRYVYVLEHHSNSGYEFIRTLTIQYRETCLKAFGVSVSITIRALVELAHICMKHEKYMSEAITHYEEIIKTTTVSTKTTTTIISTTTISTVKQQLTKAYIHVCTHASATASIIERAILVLSEQFELLKIAIGYSNSETLTVLRELVLLYWKQKTKQSQSIIVRLLLETTVAIISKEKNSRTLYEAAKELGAMYRACELIEEGRKLLREVHLQIVSKTYTSSDKCGFKIDHSIGKGAYVFLVTFEEIIQGSLSTSYSAVMANLLTETVLYESYLQYVKSGKETELLLAAGARLYVFLHKSTKKERSVHLEEEIFKIFLKKWGTIIKTRSEITLLFVVSLLKVVGQETRHIHIGTAACQSANSKIRELLAEGNFSKAYELALCAFQFIQHEGAYRHLQNISHGFKLSALMAFRELKDTPDLKIELELRTKMLDLSRKVMACVLKACKDDQIDLVRLNRNDLNDLVGLLGGQENYADLDWLLNRLWSSREHLPPKIWSEDMIISIGKRLVQARLLDGQSHSDRDRHVQKAISLCEAICYNLCRVYGSLDPKALDMSELLSQIYTHAKHYKDAMRVHEDILRLVVDGDDDDDRTLDTMEASRARKHLDLLRHAYLRLKGWDKEASVYQVLVNQLINMPVYKNDPAFKGVQGTSKWSLKENDTGMGKFVPDIRWEFVDQKHESELEIVHPAVKNHRLAMRRISSNLSMNAQLFGKRDGNEDRPMLKSPHLDILVKAPEVRIEPRNVAEVTLM